MSTAPVRRGQCGTCQTNSLPWLFCGGRCWRSKGFDLQRCRPSKVPSKGPSKVPSKGPSKGTFKGTFKGPDPSQVAWKVATLRRYCICMYSGNCCLYSLRCNGCFHFQHSSNMELASRSRFFNRLRQVKVGGSNLAGCQKSETYGTHLPRGKVSVIASQVGGSKTGPGRRRLTPKCSSSSVRNSVPLTIPVFWNAGSHFRAFQNSRTARHKLRIHGITSKFPCAP